MTRDTQLAPETDSAVLIVFLATVALAFKGVFAKLAYWSGMGVDALLLVRFGVAAPLFWIGARMMSGRFPTMDKKTWLACFGCGVLFFAATYCDFTAVSRINVGLSRLILFTFPAIVVAMNCVIERKLPSLNQVLCFVIAYSGLVLTMAPKGFGDLSADQITGIAWAFGSAITYGSYLLASQSLMRKIGSNHFTALSGISTLFVMLLVLPFSADASDFAFSATGLGWSVLIAIGCTVVPFFLLFAGIKRCGAANASLMTLSGPVITLVAAGAILGETFQPIQFIGIALTLGGVGWLELSKHVSFFKTRFCRA